MAQPKNPAVTARRERLLEALAPYPEGISARALARLLPHGDSASVSTDLQHLKGEGRVVLDGGKNIPTSVWRLAVGTRIVVSQAPVLMSGVEVVADRVSAVEAELARERETHDRVIAQGQAATADLATRLAEVESEQDEARADRRTEREGADAVTRVLKATEAERDEARRKLAEVTAESHRWRDEANAELAEARDDLEQSRATINDLTSRLDELRRVVGVTRG